MDEKERAPEDRIETPAATTSGGQAPEKAEDNPAVGQVEPEDYPRDAPDR